MKKVADYTLGELHELCAKRNCFECPFGTVLGVHASKKNFMTVCASLFGSNDLVSPCDFNENILNKEV